MVVMKRLLICTDGSSPYMDSCLKYGEWLIQRTGAVADVLYISDTHLFNFSMMADISGSVGAQPYQNLYAQLKQVEAEKSAAIQRSVEEFFKKAGLVDKVTFRHEEGSLVDSYQRYENSELGIDLVLLGKRGENANFATEHLGSSMERVVRASQRPCWVACRQYIPIKRMALAYDGSESARHALQFLIRSAYFKDIAIDLACITDNPGPEQQNKLLTAQMALNEAGYKTKVATLTGDVGDALGEYVAKNKINLLIMGAYGHSTIRHLLIGSTTTDLIRRCKISTLLFR